MESLIEIGGYFHALFLSFSAGRGNHQPPPGLESWSKRFQGDGFGEQVIGSDAKNFRKEEKFAIRHSATLQLQARHRVPADAPATQLQFDGKRGLGPASLRPQPADLLTDQVQARLHLEVDRRPEPIRFMCSHAHKLLLQFARAPDRFRILKKGTARS